MPARVTTNNTRYRFGEFVLDPAKRELQRDDTALTLPARTFECLHYLIEHRDRAVGRDELVSAVFSRTDVSDAQLAQIVLRARRAIGDDGQEQRVIRTVPRFGFRWAAPVRVLEPEAAAMAAAEAANDAPDLPKLPGAIEALSAIGETPPDPPPATPMPARSRGLAERVWRWAVDGTAALVALLALASCLLPWPLPPDAARAPAAASGAIIVLPMRVSGPGDAAWARLGMMDFVVHRLRGARLPVMSSEATLSLLQSPRGRGTADRLRANTQASWVVDGQARHARRRWQVVLSATGTAGRVQRGLGEDADLVTATRVATDRLLASIGNRQPDDLADAPADASERLQRAQSAILANDLEGARRILLEVPPAQRTAQVEYRLAQVDFLAGRYAPSLAATNRLLEDDAVRRDALLRGQLLALQGSVHMRENRVDAAERSFDAAASALATTADANAYGRALMGRGAAHAARREFDAALSDLGSARVQLLRSGDRLSVARVDANLGTVEMERDRPLQAVQYYEKAERDFEAMGAATELDGVRFMRAVAHLQLLQPTAALAVTGRAWASRAQIRDPVQLANLILVRAEALLTVGRTREARELLQLPAAAVVPPGDFHRREYLAMEIARLSGDARSAALLGDAALRDWPLDLNPRLRAWVAFRLREAALDADLPEPTFDALWLEGDALAARLGAALHARRSGDAQAAERHYLDAERLAEAGGVPGPIVNAVRAHARWLMQEGRLQEAAARIGRVAPWADQDFEVALLELELYRRLQQAPQWQAALQRAQRLAGERPIPAELTLPWPAAAAATASANH